MQIYKLCKNLGDRLLILGYFIYIIYGHVVSYIMELKYVISWKESVNNHVTDSRHWEKKPSCWFSISSTSFCALGSSQVNH